MSELLSIEDVLATATTIYESQDENGKEALRSLIDTYYSKVQHETAGRSLFTESAAFCPRCIGVRLLRKEREISITTSTLGRDYKCPICKSWYATSDVTANESSDEKEPIFIWDAKDVPERFKPLISDGWLMLVPPNTEDIPLPNGEKYNILSDGRIGEVIENGAFEVLEGAPIVPDLFGYTIYLYRTNYID